MVRIITSPKLSAFIEEVKAMDKKEDNKLFTLINMFKEKVRLIHLFKSQLISFEKGNIKNHEVSHTFKQIDVLLEHELKLLKEIYGLEQYHDKLILHNGKEFPRKVSAKELSFITDIEKLDRKLFAAVHNQEFHFKRAEKELENLSFDVIKQGYEGKVLPWKFSSRIRKIIEHIDGNEILSFRKGLHDSLNSEEICLNKMELDEKKLEKQETNIESLVV